MTSKSEIGIVHYKFVFIQIEILHVMPKFPFYWATTQLVSAGDSCCSSLRIQTVNVNAD